MHVKESYALAKARYAELAVDTDAVLAKLAAIPISLHCWQGDDVTGFDNPDGVLTGGIMATGNYPGKARTVAELRQDLDRAFSLIPGTHRLNLHAIYLDSPKPVPRDEILPEHFLSWLEWARTNNHALDFNPTCFSHPLSASGLTLAHGDTDIRNFWIRHCQASRHIAEAFGRELGTSVCNIWIPDGTKDTPVDRSAPRERLRQALDTVLGEKLEHVSDAVEAKLFGLGAESYTVGSHEFYLGYAITRQTLLCLDAGHFHPTETISDKISAVLPYVPGLLLHVSRAVRWDSDHVVTLTDDLQAIMQEIVRSGELSRIHIGLDFFDASINRIAAWVIGTRNAQKALLMALLEPLETLRQLEQSGDFSSRLALLEELKTLPYGAVWDRFCEQQGVPVGFGFIDEIKTYESTVLAGRA
jgi:L-rhamnose isomerase